MIFASSITVAGQQLIENKTYPGVVADFRRTFARLRAAPADVFLNFHAEGFGLATKRARRQAGDAAAFVDPTELRSRVDEAEKAFDAELAKQAAAP